MELREAIARAMIEEDEEPAYEAMKSYLDGYQTGLNWSSDYMPGGPFKWQADPWSSPATKAKAAASQQHYKEWHEGFKAGLVRNKKRKI